MIELDLTKAETKEYKNFKVGQNKCYINGVAIKESKAGNKMLEVRMRDAEGATLTDRLVLTDSAMWRVKQFLKACQLPHNGKVSIDEKDILGRHLIADCVAEAYKKQDGSDGTVMKVKAYIEDKDFSFAPKEEQKQSEDEHSYVPF